LGPLLGNRTPKVQRGYFRFPTPPKISYPSVPRTLRLGRFIVSSSNAERRERKVVVSELNARKREKYKPKRIFLETLEGYIEAARVKTLDQW
jgi:hypothetical protein